MTLSKTFPGSSYVQKNTKISIEQLTMHIKRGNIVFVQRNLCGSLSYGNCRPDSLIMQEKMQ